MTTNGALPADTEPGLAPGGLFVRLTTSTGEVLIERPMYDPDTAEAQATADLAVAEEWIVAHPGSTVLNHVYDGDTGECYSAFRVEDREQ
jgi:hypothetical protein